MRALNPLLPGLLLLGALAGCSAEPGVTDRAFSASGEIIAMGGGAGGAANACFTCHGLAGQGDGASAPRLAGMDAGYLLKQMQDYAAGLRADDAMSRIARALDDDARRSVVAYYAALPPPTQDETADQTAPVLYLQGDPGRGIVACAACHGAGGEGVGQGGGPALAGQPAAYTLEQIERWRDGRRRNDPRGVMAAAVNPLSDPEAHAIALWLSRQPASQAPASGAATGSASVAAAARPAASRETRRPDRSDGA